MKKALQKLSGTLHDRIMALAFLISLVLGGTLIFSFSAEAGLGGICMNPMVSCGDDGGGGYDRGGDDGDPGVSVTVTATPSTIQSGASSVVSWYANLDYALCDVTTLPNGVPTLVSGGLYSGQITVSPSATTGYRVTCYVSGNTQGFTDTTVTVTAPSSPPPSPPTASLNANAQTISSGQSSALTWTSANATSCNGSGFSTNGATSGTATVSPTVTTTYSVTCTGPGGSVTANTTVSVSPSGPSCLDWLLSSFNKILHT